MESEARLLGDPIHQTLVALPLGALGLAVLFDLIALLGGNPVTVVVAFWLIAAGWLGPVNTTVVHRRSARS